MNKGMLWTGRVLSTLVVLLTGVMPTAFLILKPEMMSKGAVDLGFPQGSAVPMVITEIVCAILYAIPQTAGLGAILLTGYLGGAVAAHVRAGEPEKMVPAIIVGLVLWAGLFLRDARVRSLIPIRKLPA